MGEQNKTSIAWRFIDAKTQSLAAQRSEHRRENRTYQGLIDFLEELHADEAVEKSFKKPGAGPVAMDVSAVS